MLSASLMDTLRGARSIDLRSVSGSLAFGLLPEEVSVVDGNAPTDDDDGEHKLNDAVKDSGIVQSVLVHASADHGADSWDEDVDDKHHKTHRGVKLGGRFVEVAHLFFNY